jgi:glutamate synthase domain-containing protein 1/glutamate synthase domain-containing protein 3
MKVMKKDVEGGCGVVGFCSTEKIAGKHLIPPCIQMHNRGNGKGGGVVAMGLKASQLNVTEEILKTNYLIQIAFLKPEIREEVESQFIFNNYDVFTQYKIKTKNNSSSKLEILPPEVYRYFCRVKKPILKKFMKSNSFKNFNKAEDEFVFLNSFQINKKFYSEDGAQEAFVLCHGKNMIVFKIVGYAEDAIDYYNLMDLKAHLWVGHQRYPTRGRVWHPGGAHPFIGLKEALVHNGDFANYHSICEYLHQNGREPLFSTDTEVAALLFDLWTRIYEYPLEYAIEAFAPTTERDFAMLSTEKQQIYQLIQSYHVQNSPDGPWFFIIARNDDVEDQYQLLGITDTSMLRPQVFALQENDNVKIGIIASEKQAIDSILSSISEEDNRYCSIADLYWNARGGSYTDGGAFLFNLKNNELSCTDKFGTKIKIPKRETLKSKTISDYQFFPDFYTIIKEVANLDYGEILGFLKSAELFAKKGDSQFQKTVEVITKLIDRVYSIGNKKRSNLLALYHKTLYSIFRGISIDSKLFKFFSLQSSSIPFPDSNSQCLIIDGKNFCSEGPESLASILVKAFNGGWVNFILFDLRGQRFCGCGFGSHSKPIRIDVYGSPGDYLGSGITNTEIFVHSNGQDQWGQIMKSGKLVVYGDVGQTFLYGAKGGTCYVRGNAAGRALINAVGHPRVIINGSCLDYLAESFMAGNVFHDGGFVILNGISLNIDGLLEPYPEPYPGGNLFSLASGGAIYIRDPFNKTSKNQLNGGSFASLSSQDWNLIKPYLEENERLFGIKIDDLLTVSNQLKTPEEVYRKIVVESTEVLK